MRPGLVICVDPRGRGRRPRCALNSEASKLSIVKASLVVQRRGVDGTSVLRTTERTPRPARHPGTPRGTPRLSAAGRTATVRNSRPTVPPGTNNPGACPGGTVYHAVSSKFKSADMARSPKPHTLPIFIHTVGRVSYRLRKRTDGHWSRGDRAHRRERSLDTVKSR